MTEKINPVKYARKPFYVDALQVTDENMEAVAQWCGGTVKATTGHREGQEPNNYIEVDVHMPATERQKKAFVGDWVLSSYTGFKVYTAKAFLKSFRKVTKLSKEEADRAGIKVPIEEPAPKNDVASKMKKVANVGRAVREAGLSQPVLSEEQARAIASPEPETPVDTEVTKAKDVDFRDAESGQYVTEEYAAANPDTTVAESD